MNKASNEQLADWVSDIVTLEGHIEEAMDGQLKLTPQSQGVATAIRTFHDTVRDSKRRAVAFKEEIGGATASGVQKTAGELLGKAAGVVGRIRKDSVSKALRDDYVAFNDAAISYTMLHTTALALKDDKTVSFAERGLETYASLVQQVNSVIPQAIIDDLVTNKDVPVADASVADSARQTIDRVWTKTSH